MQRMLLLSLFTFCVLVTSANSQQSARRIFEANNRQFIEAFNKGDAAAVANMYTVDGRLLSPNSDIVEGRANIQKFWQGAMTAGLKMVSLDMSHFETHGNIAIEVGHYTTTLPGAGGSTVTDRGKYVVVWKRQGSMWKLAIDSFSTNLPQVGS